MIRPGRFVLGEEPQQVDTTNDDELPNRSVTIVAQTAGTIVICENAEGFLTGARVPVIVGQSLNFDGLTGKEKVWLASPDAVAVDIIETGVS